MKKEAPLFSIIVPTYNRSDLLERCIKSILTQTFEKWELWIIDDGSSDGTKQCVESFTDDRIHYKYQSKNDRSQARNLGISLANGLFICFIDDDDYILDYHLKIFFNQIILPEYNQEILRVGYFREEKDIRIKSANYQKNVYDSPLHFAAFNMCGVWSLCIPRGYLINNLFPINFPHWQDTHLILRLLSKYPLKQLETYSYVYVIHDRMGSIAHFDRKNALARVELNVNAIRDLFDQYPDVKQQLPDWTQNYLISEKYLGHATHSLNLSRRLAWKLFLRSCRSSRKLLPSKLKFLGRYFFPFIFK